MLTGSVRRVATGQQTRASHDTDCRIAAGGTSDDAGSAVVEFLALALLLIIPLVYVLLVAFRLQASAFALAGATREAGRAFITASSSAEAPVRATAAARVALADHDLTLAADGLLIDCTPTCRLEPGTRVSVRIVTEVSLPLVPAVLGGGRLVIRVDGEHVEYVDRYARGR